ncbi:MAG: PaaI family thioesterase [Hyphomicrobiaceae bacterium]|nr:PaaI family thioesterase [Hyphomicrobiaceae bacterium]
MSEKSAYVPERRRSGYRTLVGYTTRVWTDNYGEVELLVGPQHMNSIGIVHGGVYASLLDAAFGHAVSYCAVPGNARYSTTVSLTTTFLKGAGEGVLRASAKVDAVDGRLATCTGEVRDAAGNLLAVAQGSFLYFPGSERPEGQPRRKHGD